MTKHDLFDLSKSEFDAIYDQYVFTMKFILRIYNGEEIFREIKQRILTLYPEESNKKMAIAYLLGEFIGHNENKILDKDFDRSERFNAGSLKKELKN